MAWLELETVFLLRDRNSPTCSSSEIGVCYCCMDPTAIWHPLTVSVHLPWLLRQFTYSYIKARSLNRELFNQHKEIIY